MKLDSDIFDGIRTSRSRGKAKTASQPASGQTCDYPDCNKPGTHRAPKGRRAEGEFFYFCIDHVREYNKSYNYFSGMSDDAIRSFQKDASTGHRPTWDMADRVAQRNARKAKAAASGRYSDPFGVFGDRPAAEAQAAEQTDEPKLMKGQKRALDTLGLDGSATAEDIRARYKELVKRHHPDSNGGDRSTEHKLREAIKAYRYLKSSGMV
ncbi:MAG: J domain-containing protein [Pseudomonadota bacterium]